MLESGKRAPDFELSDQDGQRHTLQSLLADGPLILYFYPADFTPGCTKEACSFRDLHQELQKARLRVVGVSPQDVASHRRFAEEHGLNFTLLADPGKRTVKAYGVDGPLGIGVRRGTYLIARDGTIIDSVLADLRIGAHEAFVRKAIESGAKLK
ncbi:MAG: peroxiredoxin [Lysobacterales bacterium]|jgi:peroxiredoxin Q/BCP|nr:MAG: peroxiredoxin [Xanthomonadales bacterium]